MELLFEWLYGRGLKSEHIREKAKLCLSILKKERVEYLDLCERLGIKLKPNDKPNKLFYKVVNPLKSVGIVESTRTITSKDKFKTTYGINLEGFRGYMKSIVDQTIREIEALK